MEVSDFNDILNVRAIKMETSDVVFEENAADSTDTFPMPQYVTESDLGMILRETQVFSSFAILFSNL